MNTSAGIKKPMCDASWPLPRRQILEQDARASVSVRDVLHRS